MNTCLACNHEFNNESMADFIMCIYCKQQELQLLGYVYMDSLGIGWTEEDLTNAGGILAIEKLCEDHLQRLSGEGAE